jgi:hypothetical protein
MPNNFSNFDKHIIFYDKKIKRKSKILNVVGKVFSSIHLFSKIPHLTSKRIKAWFIIQNLKKDVESPDALLRLARLRLARLRLNDGAKLWVSFKLCFKTNIFYHTYWRNHPPSPYYPNSPNLLQNMSLYQDF